MQKISESDSDCFQHLFTGNCLDRQNCPKRHLELQAVKKSKLKFNKKKEFQPDPKVLNTIAQAGLLLPSSDASSNCECCRGFPNSCRTTQICTQLGKCFCSAQGELEDELIRQGERGAMRKGHDCACCKDDIFNCKDVLCQQLGMCQCQMRKEIEETKGEEDDPYGDYFLPEYSDCQCCGGYVLSCGGEDCINGCSCLL